MKNSKTYQLIHSLTKKEISAFKKRIKKKNKNYKLFCSYTLYMSNHEVYYIRDFFKFYYKKPYIQNKDNALRNEFRLLNKLLEDFILEIQFLKIQKENYYFSKKLLLNYLLERNILNLFEKEIIKVFKRIDAQEDYFDFYTFFELWTRFQNKKFSFDSRYFSQSKDFYKKGIIKWFKEVSFKTRKLELFISFIERTNMQIEEDIPFTEPIQCIDISQAKDSNYINYIEHKIKSFKTYNQEKLDVLIKSLDILKNINNYYVNNANEEFSLLQTIGVEYMIHAKNKKAKDFFKQVINLKGKIEDSLFIKGLYNYINVEIKLREYKKAIALYIQYNKEISDSLLLEIFNNTISMCYILINKTKYAEKLTTVISSKVSTENNIYSRCNIAIIHFLNKNIDLSLNELNNIKQTIHYHHHSNNAHVDFINNFRHFIHLQSISYEIKDHKAKFQLIKKDILKNISKSNKNYSGDSLHNLWLIKEITKTLNSLF